MLAMSTTEHDWAGKGTGWTGHGAREAPLPRLRPSLVREARLRCKETTKASAQPGPASLDLVGVRSFSDRETERRERLPSTNGQGSASASPTR